MKELNASPGISYPTESTEEKNYPASADFCLPCTSKDGAIQSGVTILSVPQSRVRNSDLHASPEIPSLQVQALSPGISQAQEEPPLHEADSAAGKRDVSMMSP